MHGLINDTLGHRFDLLASKEKICKKTEAVAHMLVLTRVCKQWYFCIFCTQTSADFNVQDLNKKNFDIEKMFQALQRCVKKTNTNTFLDSTHCTNCHLKIVHSLVMRMHKP